ncbi:MAG: hypothetical protein E7342_02600 [Clostridiales bacterium]|nr:hypothetical protein [Clostridiales bacterium]
MTGVIDIGSNSVRLLISDSGRTIYKNLIITKLSENMFKDNLLKDGAIKRTIDAILEFKRVANSFKVESLVAFATAAVRNSHNGLLFCQEVKEKTGVDVEVVSGEKEAKLGLFGVLGSSDDGGIIDIGGASTEITVRKGKEVVYSKSVYVGTVATLNNAGQDLNKINKFVDEKILEFGNVENSNFFAIGGTATQMAAIDLKLEVYDRTKVHLYKLTKNSLEKIISLLSSKTPEERKDIKGVQIGREDVILGGAVILYKIMSKLNIDYVTISENDNLEGYLKVKENEKEN